jgi:hypothetical protein
MDFLMTALEFQILQNMPNAQEWHWELGFDELAMTRKNYTNQMTDEEMEDTELFSRRFAGGGGHGLDVGVL